MKEFVFFLVAFLIIVLVVSGTVVGQSGLLHTGW